MNWSIEIDPRLWSLEGESTSEWCKRVNDTFSGGLLNYNPETHELVEKKETKVKRLKEELSHQIELKKRLEKIADDYSRRIIESCSKRSELEEQLKELED